MASPMQAPSVIRGNPFIEPILPTPDTSAENGEDERRHVLRKSDFTRWRDQARKSDRCQGHESARCALPPAVTWSVRADW
jgi:hypothetical protein